jgi:integrase
MVHLMAHKQRTDRQKKALGSEFRDFDLVVSTFKGTPLNTANVRRTFNRLIEATNVPKIRFHDLRHTHATALLSKEVNIKVISERLGHSNIKVTLDTYSHVLPTMQKDAVRKLDQIIQ